MSSLSLPRVLQQRKTSLELERENFEKFQAASISKAINHIEHPVKEKHVRSAILGTFHEKCAETFWSCALRLPLQENRIVAWKFCHVLHKVLREGHPNAIPNSHMYRTKIEDLGKLWGHLREGYGKLIQHYCQLLIAKLDFHRRNPRFPGNLTLSKEELDHIGENDINNYFQMSVEMFDYMDEILALQAAIFGSLDMSRSNSMTSCGQCRLAPLIPMIQDSSQLYDFCVKILFRLHASLPQDVLTGHRQRFLKQFRDLKQFYLAAATLQYFKNLISVPTLPDNPPNFMIQAELRSYVTPVVILPPEEPPDLDSTSTTDLVDVGSTQNNGSITLDALVERDNIIEHLQNEISQLRAENQRMALEHQKLVSTLSEKVAALETELATKESELMQERSVKDDLLQQTEVVAKYHEMEKRAKASEEKFQKLKEVYTKVREEHIQLLRQKAGADKALRGADKMTKFARAANSLIVSIKADVDKQLANVRNLELESEKTRLEAVLQELAALQATASAASEQNQALESKIDWISAEKAQIESELQDLLSQKEELDVRYNEVQEELKIVQQYGLNAQKDLFEKVVSASEEIIEKSRDEIRDPDIVAINCSPGYIIKLVPSLEECLLGLENDIKVDSVISLSHMTAHFVLLGKGASNTAHDIEFGDGMAGVCKEVAEACLSVLAAIQSKDSVKTAVGILQQKIRDLAELAKMLSLTLKGEATEFIGDLVENELAVMDKAIEEASRKIEVMLTQSRAADSGLKLEVNEKILDSCTTLMKAIRVLVQKSRLLQAEIVTQGKGSASVKEFYKRNHQWYEGLISAAKAVGMGANFLLTAADQVVSGEGKMEKLIVASQGIAASTVQLVVASRVKADKNSSNLSALSAASREVTQATGGVVATAKTCGQLVEETEELDISGLNLHQAKRLEMEAQVKVLELEASLEKERLHLSALRRHHYQLAGEPELAAML